ncbi:transposase [Nonomuraea cavernae]|nr:transposase [Nonomuraea cavernae]
MIEVCSGAEPVEFNSGGNRVHLLVHYPPKIALSTLANSLKDVSARFLRTRHISVSTCGADISGRRPTSPPPAAAHSNRSSRSTSTMSASRP